MDKVKELIRQASESAVLRDPQATAYWAYHTARISFFVGQVWTLCRAVALHVPPYAETQSNSIESKSTVPRTHQLLHAAIPALDPTFHYMTVADSA